jgi:hypothetical protein
MVTTDEIKEKHVPVPNFLGRSQNWEKQLLASSCLSVRMPTTQLQLGGFS